ncbi:hypothetical protein MGH68_13505 [Erysipelothrix sp. D19-032]
MPGYLADAKYYVNLTMLQQPYPKETGASIIYSSHATSRMASTIAKHWKLKPHLNCLTMVLMKESFRHLK